MKIDNWCDNDKLKMKNLKLKYFLIFIKIILEICLKI